MRAIEDGGDRSYVLDVQPGTSVGFSLEAVKGFRYTLREITERQCGGLDYLTKNQTVEGLR